MLYAYTILVAKFIHVTLIIVTHKNFLKETLSNCYSLNINTKQNDF